MGSGHIMKKLLITLFWIFLAAAAFLIYLLPPEKQGKTNSPYQISSANKDKKKVLIFSSPGGGGHISATRAIEQYLGNDFCVGSAFIYKDVLQEVDPLLKLSNHSGEDVYNYFLKRKWIRPLNVLLPNFGNWYYTLRERTVIPILESYLQQQKPDLLISVIPAINNLLLKTAQKLNIPFLIVPTDLDGNMALQGIVNPTYEKFKLALSYDNNEIRKTIAKNKIDPKYINYAGFPVRTEFFGPLNTKSVKKDFDFPEAKAIVLLVMGAQGSQELYEFTKQLTRVQIPIHLVVVLGKSESLRRPLKLMPKPKNMSMTILGYTNRMHDLMRTADILITKSGSVSFNEGIYAQVPMLLDGTGAILKWEQFNHNFVKQNGFGGVISRAYRLPGLVTQMLTNQKLKEHIKKGYAQFEKPNPEQRFKLLIRQMVNS